MERSAIGLAMMGLCAATVALGGCGGKAEILEPAHSTSIDLPSRVLLDCSQPCRHDDLAFSAEGPGARPAQAFSIEGGAMQADEFLEFVSRFASNYILKSEVDLSGVAVELRVYPPCRWDCALEELADDLGLEIAVTDMKVVLKPRNGKQAPATLMIGGVLSVYTCNGIVEVQRAGSLSWQPVEPGTLLNDGDRIRTLVDSSASLCMTNGETFDLEGPMVLMVSDTVD